MSSGKETALPYNLTGAKGYAVRRNALIETASDPVSYMHPWLFPATPSDSGHYMVNHPVASRKMEMEKVFLFVELAQSIP